MISHWFQFCSEFCVVATLKMGAACFYETYVADRRSAWCRCPPYRVQSGGCLYRPNSHRSFLTILPLSHLISSDWNNLAAELPSDGSWHISVSGLAGDTTESVTVLPRCERVTGLNINPLAPELFFFLILAHPVYKMWIIQEPNKLALWNKLHFEEKKNGEYRGCLKYSVPIFVE